MALQEIIGSDRWYGTMPKGCMTVWIMETTDHEEIIATVEMKAKEEEKQKKKIRGMDLGPAKTA
jgi:hypothetical protein